MINKKIIPILMYHDISAQNNNDLISIQEFENQISFINKIGFKSFNLRDLDSLNNKNIIITFDDGYESTFKFALPILKKYNFKATCFIVSKKINEFNDWDANQSDYRKSKLMSQNQILEWNKEGYEIGSHSQNHYDLCKLNLNDKEIAITEPINFFNRHYNINIQTFCYPYGSYDQESKTIVKKHYKFAVTTKRSRYNEKFNNFELPRIPMNKNTSKIKILLKLKTIYEDIKFR